MVELVDSRLCDSSPGGRFAVFWSFSTPFVRPCQKRLIVCNSNNPFYTPQCGQLSDSLMKTDWSWAWYVNIGIFFNTHSWTSHIETKCDDTRLTIKLDGNVQYELAKWIWRCVYFIVSINLILNLNFVILWPGRWKCGSTSERRTPPSRRQREVEKNCARTCTSSRSSAVINRRRKKLKAFSFRCYKWNTKWDQHRCEIFSRHKNYSNCYMFTVM